MKLTEAQIQDLYTFTRKHYVEYYDVQSELVDHLANDIEAIWEENPELSFEKARDTSFKKFGIYGFMNVVEEKQRQLNKKYIATIFKFIKEWFQLPKLIITVFLVWCFFEIQRFNQSYNIYTVLYFAIILFEIVKMYTSRKKVKLKNTTTGKKWMLEDIILVQGLGSFVLILFYTFDLFMPSSKNFLELSIYGRFFTAFLMVISLLIGYITTYTIPSKIEELLEEQYPEYKLV